MCVDEITESHMNFVSDAMGNLLGPETPEEHEAPLKAFFSGLPQGDFPECD